MKRTRVSTWETSAMYMQTSTQIPAILTMQRVLGPRTECISCDLATARKIILFYRRKCFRYFRFPSNRM